MISVLHISLSFSLLTKYSKIIFSSQIYNSHLWCYEEVPAKSVGHARVFDIRVSSQAPDENRDHLQRDMLHEARQGYGRFRRCVCVVLMKKTKGHGKKV